MEVEVSLLLRWDINACCKNFACVTCHLKNTSSHLHTATEVCIIHSSVEECFSECMLGG